MLRRSLLDHCVQRVAPMVIASTDTIVGPSRSACAMRHRFGLGGVALELLPEPGFAWSLPSETAQHTSTSTELPKLAAVTCSLRVDPSLAQSAADQTSVRWEQTLDGICVRARQVVLDIVALGPRRYVVAARIGHTSLLTLMLNTLVTSIAELAGGLCLHATAVAHASGAVLLLGPSGAGKTTAAELLGADVSCLSNDRVILVPDPIEREREDNKARFWVWSLPIGKAPALPRSAAVSLPLTCLLRVQQAQTSKITPLREVEAMLQIRSAVEVSQGSEFFEPRRLLAVEALAAAAKSGVAQVALARSWRAQLEDFLNGAVPFGHAHALGLAPTQLDLRKSEVRVDGMEP